MPQEPGWPNQGAYSSVWLERTPDKREVGGSNPPRPTSLKAESGRDQLMAGSRTGCRKAELFDSQIEGIEKGDPSRCSGAVGLRRGKFSETILSWVSYRCNSLMEGQVTKG